MAGVISAIILIFLTSTTMGERGCFQWLNIPGMMVGLPPNPFDCFSIAPGICFDVALIIKIIIKGTLDWIMMDF